MSQDQGPRFRFEHQLRLEAERLLDDSSFRRAPIQSRLLRYLVERTVSNAIPPTQYEIAVDGLGKASEYDIENDSYPRVQVSRLRRNIAAYYARNRSGGGLRVALAEESYRLTLVPEGSPEEEAESEAELDADTKPGLGLPEDSDIPHSFRTPLIVLVAGVLAFLFGLALWTFSTPQPQSGTPRIALTVSSQAILADDAVVSQEVESTVERFARRQLRSSFVARLLPADAPDAEASYRVDLEFVTLSGQTLLKVTFFSSDHELLYSRSIPVDDITNETFFPELEATLVYITSPVGALAQHEIREMGDLTSSPAGCFLAIENRRTNGQSMNDLLDRCIELYPEDRLAAFWYARRAFAYYQAQAASGQPISRTGFGQEELEKALDVDPINAFANFVAAKVELANDNCDFARLYIERALQQGASYPAMVAAAEADGTACQFDSDVLRNSQERLRALARVNPDPDPLLHVYLLLGLIAVGDLETARDIAGRLVIDEPSGSLEGMSDLLRRSLEDPSFARTRRDELAANIRQFVWSESSIEEMMARLENRPEVEQ